MAKKGLRSEERSMFDCFSQSGKRLIYDEKMGYYYYSISRTVLLIVLHFTECSVCKSKTVGDGKTV